ncbi:MAG TPA: pitrilysin family protein [Blastocatellia bacterium]|nr:pitrilysin family protein [Blastocatellia bacterium]
MITKRTRFKFAALLLLLVTSQAFAKPEWQQRTLKNGLQVIVIENRSVPLVTVELAVKNGSYTEPPEFNGLSHLYEHMFFQSNERSQTDGYLDKVSEAGAQFNAVTREEVVYYHYTALKSGLRPVMSFMRDQIRYPLFDKGELEREIQVVLDEFARNEANPYFFLDEAIKHKLWYKYFSRKNIIGDRKVIESSTPEKMRTIQRKFYIPNNTALVVAGDVSAPEIFKMAEELYGDWPAGEDPFLKNPLVQHPPLQKDEAVIVSQPVNAASILISYHGPSTDTDAAATYAADVFSYALRQQDSRFYKTLVDTGLTTGATMGYYTQRNVGPIQFSAQTTPEKLKAAIKALNAEIAKLDTPDYITDEQLESAKTLLEAEEIYNREKPSEYGHTVSFWWASSGLDYYANYVENCRKVTKADIQRYVQKYIKGKHRVMGVILSEEDKKKIGLTDQDLLAK